MKKNLPLLPVLSSLLLLAACGAPIGLGAWTAGTAYVTKPGNLPPADVDNQMPPHESWCYQTLGKQVECYSEPQDTVAGRLVNVDPANRYPLNKKAYDDALAKSRMPPKPPEAEAVDKSAEDTKNPDAANPQPDQNMTAPVLQPVEVKPMPIPLTPEVANAAKPAPKAKPLKHHKKKAKKAATTKPASKAPQTPLPGASQNSTK